MIMIKIIFIGGNMLNKKLGIVAIASTLSFSSISYAGPSAEVLYWWTSGGEAKSVAVLQNLNFRSYVLRNL